MKLTKSQIKELIRHSIRELTSETKDVNESVKKRFTVKEVRMWMKKLEENRYKKVYNSDARRVAWMVNNEGVSLDEMPISMKKKWTKAQYGRERYLATEFLKSKSEKMNEGKLTEKVSDKQKRKIYKKAFGKEYDENRQQAALPLDIAYQVALYRLKKLKEGKLSEVKFKPKQKISKKEWSKIKSFNKHIGQDGTHYVMQLTNKGTALVPVIVEDKLTEAITGADRKILFILIREIVRNLKSKIRNFDVNNKSHLNSVGSSILSIIRAMTYSPDNLNYKNFKKYFPKNFNSKLIQKKLKQFHSQTDKVQVTLVTQAIKNELGAGVNESKLRGMIIEIIKNQLSEAPKDIHHSDAKFLQVSKKDVKKAEKILMKKFKPKGGFHQVEFDTKSIKVPNHIGVTVNKKIYNDVIELLMKNNINTRG